MQEKERYHKEHSWRKIKVNWKRARKILRNSEGGKWTKEYEKRKNILEQKKQKKELQRKREMGWNMRTTKKRERTIDEKKVLYEGECIGECPTGNGYYFHNGTTINLINGIPQKVYEGNVCKKCSPPCSECKDINTNCVNCNFPYIFVYICVRLYVCLGMHLHVLTDAYVFVYICVHLLTFA